MNNDQTISYAVQRDWGNGKWRDITTSYAAMKHAKILFDEVSKSLPRIKYRIVERLTEDIPIQ